MLNAKPGKKTAFIPFIMAGHPSIEDSEKIASVLIEEGADLLELGIPFSDPLADGPVIQAAAESARKKVSGAEQTIEIAARIHAKHPKTPIVLFTYYNPIHKMGIPRFAEKAKEAGMSGALVVDLPPEEAKDYCELMAKEGLKTVFLASPTTDPKRVPLIAQASTGFIYYVSRAGVTGVQKDLSSSLREEISRLRALTDKKLAVGFGISKPEHVRAVAEIADAVVVGSAFVLLVEKNAGSDPLHREVRALARELIAALPSR